MTDQTTLPPKGARKPGSRHWLFSEVTWAFVPAVWDGRLWHVDGFRDPQRPEDMIDEWTLSYVGVAGSEDDPPPALMAAFFRATISDPVALHEALT